MYGYFVLNLISQSIDSDGLFGGSDAVAFSFGFNILELAFFPFQVAPINVFFIDFPQGLLLLGLGLGFDNGLLLAGHAGHRID